MNYNFANPKPGFKQINDEIINQLKKVVQSGNYINGRNVKLFERNFRDYLSNKGHIVSCASGTDAITIALLSYDLQGKKIIVPSHTAPASIVGILRAGCIPLYCDIDNSTLMLSPQAVSQTLNKEKNIGGILCVHLYGFSADITQLKRISKENNLFLIEDCAQSTGTTFEKRMTGTLAHGGCFSFFPTKNLSTLGDGGAIWLPSKKLARRAASIAQYGWNNKRIVTLGDGMNSRLDEIHAAILNIRLKHLKRDIEKRRAIASRYDHELSNFFKRIEKSIEQNPSYHLYVVRVRNRSKLINKLKEKGINIGIHYYPPNHLNGKLSQHSEDLKITEKISKEIISLPIYPELSLKDQAQIIKTLNESSKFI